MNMRTILLLSLGLALRSAPAAEIAATNHPAPAQLPGSAEALDDRQKLGPGDRVTYRVIEDQDEAQTLTITDSGDLEVPYYGFVHAAGKTSRQLAREIQALLERDLYHQATVILAVELVDRTRTQGRVFVTGQVRNQGGFDIPAGENFTVSKAILVAGGFSDFSDKRNVKLVRKTPGGTQTFEVNVQEIWTKGRLDRDLVVQPNDLIVVPARLVNF